MPEGKRGYVPIQMKISIPNAGELFVGVLIPEDFCLTFPPTPAEIAFAATEEVMSRIKVAPVTGELERVKGQFKPRAAK